jgi:catechol 2,3-dioxygenase-like lactoylglutathione lyase family enzyme
MALSLGTIVCYVNSVTASAAFYSDLGFEVNQLRSDYALVSLGNNITFSLHEESSETIPEFQAAAAVRPRGASVYFYFEVPDIDAWAAEHAAACSYSEPISRPWGKREMLVSDPDGYMLMFYS